MVEICLASNLQSPNTKVTKQPITMSQQQLSLQGAESSREVWSVHVGI